MVLMQKEMQKEGVTPDVARSRMAIYTQTTIILEHFTAAAAIKMAFSGGLLVARNSTTHASLSSRQRDLFVYCKSVQKHPARKRGPEL